MRNYNYDSWLTSFLDYEDEDEELTDEEIEALKEEAAIARWENNQRDE
jgi:hypothetical protein